MRFAKTLSAALLATSLAAGAAHAQQPTVVPDRILIQIPGIETHDDAIDAIDRLASEVGAPLSLERASILDWYVLEVAGADELDRAGLQPIADRLQEHHAVTGVALDRIMQPFANFNDPGLPQQHSVDLLGLAQAWDYSVGTSDVVVAVVDTGIVPHEDLQGAVLGGYDFVSDAYNAADGNGRDADPFDDGGTPIDCGGQAGSSRVR